MARVIIPSMLQEDFVTLHKHVILVHFQILLRSSYWSYGFSAPGGIIWSPLLKCIVSDVNLILFLLYLL